MEQARRVWVPAQESGEAEGWGAGEWVAISQALALMVIVYVQNAGRLYPIKGGSPVMNTAARNAAHQ